MHLNNKDDNDMSLTDPILIAICSKAVNVANGINAHLVDCAEGFEAQNRDVRSFTAKFSRLREILLQIHKELLQMAQDDTFVPYKESQSLLTKLQSTTRDLITSELMVLKLVTRPRKTGFSKFMQGFKSGSFETEIIALGDSLGRHRESLAEAWISLSKSVTSGSSNGIALSPIQRKANSKRRVSMSPDALPTHSDARPNLGKTDGATTHNVFQLDLSPTDSMGHPQRNESLRSISRSIMPATGSSQPHGLYYSTFVSPDVVESMDSSHEASLVGSVRTPFPNESVTSATESPATTVDGSDLWPLSKTAASKGGVVDAFQDKDYESLRRLLKRMPQKSSIPPSLLTEAVGSNDVASVRLLLTNSIPVDGVDNNGNTALLVAVATWSIDLVKLLLHYGANPDFCPSNADMSALTLAARQNQLETVQLMLEKGADVNALPAKGESPLNTCICNGVKPGIVALLLKAGANPNTKTQNGKTPLVEALTIKRFDFVKLLLDHGANPNLAGPKHPLWPATYLPAALRLLIERGAKTRMALGNIELAASLNNIHSVQILLDAGVSPNEKKDGVYTALCSAIRDDRADIVDLLLRYKADPNLKASEYPAWKCISHDRLHFLPALVAAGADLHVPPGIAELAVAHNNKEALVYLLHNSVDVNKTNDEGRTALTTAIRDGRSELIDLLFAHGARVLVRGEDWPLRMALENPPLLKKLLQHTDSLRGVTKGIIELAVQANQLESIKILVETGISVEERTGGVFSPLTSAIRENRKEIVHYLVDEAGADVNSPGEHLPLIKAIRRRVVADDNEIIEFLLQRGADINLLYRGWNAIMEAVEHGDKKLLNLLIEKGNGIDLQIVDISSKQTVYEMIRERGWSEGVDLLVEHHQKAKMITDGSYPQVS